MKLTDMKSVLVHEIKDLLSAEKQLIKALPKLANACSDATLRQAIEDHLEETQNHVTRLEQVCDELGIAPRAVKCEAMEGLIGEAQDLMEQDADEAVLDAALIAAAQRVEHYEIAAYGSARAFAEQLGLDAVADLLQQTLDEEGAADEKLTEIAQSSVNPRAVGAATGAESE